jgi:UDP-GlcNAc:undecaprenyl-phosphate GlcNAc-1-phosphate transferase
VPAVAFAISVLATPLMRRLAVANGIVDWPDLKRKSHVKPVAYLGGVALFLGWLGGVALSFFLANPFASRSGAFAQIEFPITILVGAAVITLTGLADDVFGMSPRVKIGGQLLTAAALTWKSNIGTRLVSDCFLLFGFHPPDTAVYVLGAAVITFFVVGGCNSLNLLDGLDGLAAGVSGIAALGFLFIATYVALSGAVGGATVEEDWVAVPVRVVMSLAILGSVLGFLVYNFNPATIFMGDAGALLLGYLGVSTILMFAQVPFRGPLLVMAALIVFALPITDTTLAIVRRKMRGQAIFSPDNQHLHHIFLRMAKRRVADPNAAVKLAVGVMYALALIFAALGCSLARLQWRYVIGVFGCFFVAIIIAAYRGGQRYALAQRAADAAAAMAAPAQSPQPQVGPPAESSDTSSPR